MNFIFKFLAQTEYAECLPACVDMVLQYYGMRIQRESIRRILGYTPIGTQSSNTLQVSKLGVKVQYGVASSERVLIAALERQVPPLCFIDTGALPYWQYSCHHAVVVLGVSLTHVIVNDPAYAEKSQVKVPAPNSGMPP